MKLKSIFKHRQLLLIIFLCIGIFTMVFYYNRVDLPLQKRYASTAHEMFQQTEILIEEKNEAILLIALSMGQDVLIRDSLHANRPINLDFKHFTKRFALHTTLKNFMVSDHH